MKKVVVILLLASVIFAGCTEKTNSGIETEAGKTTVSEKTTSGVTGAGSEWCGESGRITTYKGKQVCEFESKSTMGGTEISTQSYTTQDGSSFFAISKDSSGNVVSEQEVRTGLGGWCNAGYTIISTVKLPGGQMMTTNTSIIGITTYKGKQVCEMVTESSSGTEINYMTQDGSYSALIRKDASGNVVGEYENP